ncbi:MAG: phosphoglycerate dehydrogenase, partial [Nocardioidaceae bacterium]
MLLESVHPVAEEILTHAGMSVQTARGAMDEDELVTALQDVDVLGIRSKTQVPAAVLDRCPHLMAVGAFCIGTNQIDLGAASRRGVAVFN